MNILQIIAFISIGLCGYITIKFIYKNFMKLFKHKEWKKPEKERITKQDESNTLQEFVEFFKKEIGSEGDGVAEFIKRKLHNDMCYGYHSKYGNTNNFTYKLLHLNLFTKQEIDDLVSEYKQYILDIEKEKTRINNAINTGFYVSNDRKLFYDFNEISTIVNIGEFENRGVDAKYSSDVRVHIKAKHTCVIFKSGTQQEIKENDELVELFIQFKGIKK